VAQVLAGWKTGRQAQDRPGAVHGEVASNLERFLNRSDIGLKVGVEERFAHDQERHAHQFGDNIKHLTRASVLFPVVQHFESVAFHDAYEACHLGAMESGLGHFALALPQCAVAGKQAVTERELQNPIAAAFAVIRGIGDQDLLDLIRMTDLKRSPETAVANDVAEFSGVPGKTFERSLAELR
jgi:hypothetical protein